MKLGPDFLLTEVCRKRAGGRRRQVSSGAGEGNRTTPVHWESGTELVRRAPEAAVSARGGAGMRCWLLGGRPLRKTSETA